MSEAPESDSGPFDAAGDTLDSSRTPADFDPSAKTFDSSKPPEAPPEFDPSAKTFDSSKPPEAPPDFDPSAKTFDSSKPPEAPPDFDPSAKTFDSSKPPEAPPDFDPSAKTFDSSKPPEAPPDFDPSAKTFDSSKPPEAPPDFDPSAKTFDSSKPPEAPPPPPPPHAAPVLNPSAGDFRDAPTLLTQAEGVPFAPGTTPPGAVQVGGESPSSDPITQLKTIKDQPRAPGVSATWREGQSGSGFASGPAGPGSAISASGFGAHPSGTPSDYQRPDTHAAESHPDKTQVYPIDSTLGQPAAPSGIDPSLASHGRKKSGGVSTIEAPGTIGDYQILRELGRGGMGVVYEAVSQTLGRKVALKVLLAGAGATEHDRARFLVEAKAASNVRHPNVVAVLEYKSDGNDVYLAMDMIEGTPLNKKVEEEGHFEDHRSANIALKMTEAIEAAHEKGVLHRDIKPHNVILDSTRNEEPMLTDFGLAKLLEDKGVSLTATGPVMMGTPGYMPPEQAGVGHKIDGRADVYSLGATLYFMLTGRPPFQGKSMPEVLMSVIQKRPMAPSRRRQGVAPALETICLKCLEKEPADRYQSSEALAEDLRRFLSNERIQGRLPGALGRVQRWAGRNPLAAAAGAVGAFLAMIVILWGAQVVQEARQTLANNANASPTVRPSPSGSVGPSPSGSVGPSPSGSVGPSPSGSVGPSPSGSVEPSPTAEPSPTVVVPPPDMSAPDLVLVEPAKELRTRDDQLSVIAFAKDDRELDRVELDGQPLSLSEEEHHYAGSWPLSGEGLLEATLLARDVAGNVTSRTVTVIRDVSPPVLEQARWGAESGTVEDEEIQVTLLLNEPGSGTIGGIVAEAGELEGVPTLRATVPLQLGSNTFPVSLEDELGNSGSSEVTITRTRFGVLEGADWWEVSQEQLDFARAIDQPVVLVENGITFVLIPPGTFVMGSATNEPGYQAEVQHLVQLTKGFYLSAHEVTNGLYDEVMGLRQDRGQMEAGRRTLTLGEDLQPAVGLTQRQATDFCQALAARADSRGLYRLPSEAEWEYACRAGTSGPWYWGDSQADAQLHMNVLEVNSNSAFGRFNPTEDMGVRIFNARDDGHEASAPVGSFPANPWGLFDMLGNAREWVADWFDEYGDVQREQVDPTGPVRESKTSSGRGRGHVHRGGSFFEGPDRVRAGQRSQIRIGGTLQHLGFRVARDLRLGGD